jgi:hypothetical protein
VTIDDRPKPEPPGDVSLAPVMAMIAHLDPFALAEFNRALALRIRAPAPTAAVRRWSRLGLLAEVLESAPIGLRGFPMIERGIYDGVQQLSHANALSSRQLVDAFGSWPRACRAAAGLQPDGTKTAPRQPWPQAFRGGTRPAPYTEEEVVGAVRQCAFELGRRPSSADYHRWCTHARAQARARGLPCRLPTIRTIYRLFPARRGDPPRRRWQRVLDAARITDIELAAVRAGWVPGNADSTRTGDGLQIRIDRHSPLGALACADPDRLTRIGIKREQRDGLLATADFGPLWLSRAAALASLLEGSLDWLAARTSEPTPAASADARFDHEQFSALRRSAHLPEKTVRAKLGRMPHPTYRQLIAGAREPTLRETAIMANLLTTTIDNLCVESGPDT